MKIYEFQGGAIFDTPELPGIYAWYYKPRMLENRQVEILVKLITNPCSVKTEVAMRYNLVWAIDSDAAVLYGKERNSINRVLAELIDDGGDLTKSFIQKFMVPYFAKPLYIGISDNLSVRVEDHYNSLTRLWDSDTPVSRYLARHPDADVEEVLDQLDLDHTFAIDARVKGIVPRDLVVCVCLVETPVELRKLEQVLQILADPICGRS